MIGRDEIEAKATEFDIGIHNVERDYVFGWLLKAFYENEFLANTLLLKGGNAFRKAYFPETRFSSDLDFSVRTELDVERLQAAINAACEQAGTASGVQFEIDRNRIVPGREIDDKRKSYKGQVYFRDFYGEEGKVTISVRLDLTEFDRLYLDPEPRPLIHPYSDAAACTAELKCVALEELMANKLKCLIQRRHTFDLYDFVYATFVDPPPGLRRDQIVRVFLRKTIFEPSPGAAKEILLGLPFTFFKGVWNKYIVCPVRSRFDFETAEAQFRQAVEELFAGFGVGRPSTAFVPATFRNSILEAGGGRKLVRVTYHGVTREVEPYALSYKRRQDGRAFEYFYGWDRTGGKSGPGIKAFLPHEIASVEATDVEFEPRYEIELSKAGEAPEKGYFSGKKSFGAGERTTVSRRTMGTRPRRAKTSSPWKQTYKVQCMMCSKTFTRTKPGTTLNPHKGPGGWPCSGRRGYRVF